MYVIIGAIIAVLYVGLAAGEKRESMENYGKKKD